MKTGETGPPAGPRSGQAASAPGIREPPRPLPALPTAEGQAGRRGRRRRDASAAPPATGRGPVAGSRAPPPNPSRSAGPGPTTGGAQGPAEPRGRSPGSGTDFRERQPKRSSAPTTVPRLVRSSCGQSARSAQARRVPAGNGGDLAAPPPEVAHFFSQIEFLL